MSAVHGPSIPTRELKILLDANNDASFPGSGTKIFDVSGNFNTYNMYGTVPRITTSNYNYWDFAGMNNGDSSLTTGNAPLGFTSAVGGLTSMGLTRTGSFTISFWYTHDGGGGQISLVANAGGADGFRFGPSSGGYYWLMGPAYREGINFTGAGTGDDNWHLVSGVFDRANEYGRSGGATVYLYHDGELLGDVGNFGSQTTMNNGSPNIGRNPCCLRFDGKLNSFFWHDTALDARECKQLYDAYAPRFT